MTLSGPRSDIKTADQELDYSYRHPVRQRHLIGAQYWQQGDDANPKELPEGLFEGPVRQML
jgi:hypothetical protein